jgi:hypothetical protein
MDRKHYVERIPFGDRRLGRNINHDPQSRLFPYRGPRRADPVSVRHQAHIGILDQGNVGACTGFAGVRCLATGRFWPTLDGSDRYQPTHDGAMALYSRATEVDPYRGQYPPQDTGSDGLSIAKVLTEAGEIVGYEHAFTVAQAVAALQERPVITGTVWLEEMFSPDANGMVHPAGAVAGGHEYCGDEYVRAGDRFGTRQVVATEPTVGFSNSWGTGFGDAGRFYMTVAAWAGLLDQDGDVTVFVPADQAAPDPEGDDPDGVFAATVAPWARGRGPCNKRVATAARVWLDAKGL